MGIAAVGLLCLAFVLLIAALISGLFCYSLMRTMNGVSRRNRQIVPGLVWLHMLHLLGTVTSIIPVAGEFISPVFAVGVGIWDLVMVFKIAGSLRAEYKSRKMRVGKQTFGRSVGVPWACFIIGLPVVSFIVGLVVEAMGADQDLIMIFGGVALLALLVQAVLFVIYWVEIHGYGTKLLEDGGGGRRRTAEEEDYADGWVRPRRRRSRAREDEDDEDEDDRPRNRRRDEEDDDEDDRPRRRRRRDEDDDD
jgi:hypothetical protein